MRFPCKHWQVWETGTRNLGVHRLVEVCHALEVRPGAVLGRAHDLVYGKVDVPLAMLNLADLASTTVPELQPLRPWADIRAREIPPGATPELPLTRASLNNLATLCDTTPFQLIRLLR